MREKKIYREGESKRAGLEEMLEFKYPGMMLGKDLTHRLQEKKNTWTTLRKLWKEKTISRQIKRSMYERVAKPS